MFTFSVAQSRMTCRLCSVVVLLGSAMSQFCAAGHRSCSVRLVTQSLGESVKSSLHQSERALGCLILITAIHHVRLSLPPHVCFDLFLSSTVTVKDEGPCGRTGTVPWKPAAQAAALVPARSSMHWPQPQLGAPCRGWEGASSVGRGGDLPGWLIADPKV